MPGLKLVLPNAFTDTSLPQLRDDPRLNAGSLILADLAHPANPLAAGVPVDNTPIPNIAWKEAAALCGVSGATSASLPLTYRVGSGLTGTKGKVERTAKGGIHAIVSQAVALAAGDGLQTIGAAAIRTYLMANVGHLYYTSVWMRPTRLNPSAATKGLAYFEFGSANTGGAIVQMMDSAANGYSPLAASLGDVPVPMVLGTQRGSHATLFPPSRSITDLVTNSTTTVTSATAAFTSADVGKNVSAGGIPSNTVVVSVTNSTTVVLSVAATTSVSGQNATIGGGLGIASNFNAGPTAGYANGSGNTYNVALIGSRNNTADSFVAYSWQLCDLTAAGLTYAQADAIDAAEYNSAFNTPAGRYYNDTIPTAPSTIA